MAGSVRGACHIIMCSGYNVPYKVDSTKERDCLVYGTAKTNLREKCSIVDTGKKGVSYKIYIL